MTTYTHLLIYPHPKRFEHHITLNTNGLLLRQSRGSVRKRWKTWTLDLFCQVCPVWRSQWRERVVLCALCLVPRSTIPGEADGSSSRVNPAIIPVVKTWGLPLHTSVFYVTVLEWVTSSIRLFILIFSFGHPWLIPRSSTSLRSHTSCSFWPNKWTYTSYT